MKAKKLVLLLDVIVVAIVAIAMMTGTVIKTTNLAEKPQLMAEQTDLSFDLIASPEEKRVKAGETVEITLSAKNIKIEKEGLNSIVGKLGYNENLFEKVEVKAEEQKGWNIELNQIKGHSMYGKFCIYTMKEGVTDNQDVVKLTMKLKKDLKPQTTKVTFTELASSNGEVEVPEEDREVTIIIYEDGVPTPEPEKPDPVQTSDNKIVVIIAIVILTILLNVLTFGKNKKEKVLSTILVMVIGLSCAGIISYAAENNINVKEVLNRLSYKQSWLNSEKYLVTEENVSRIAPGTKVETVKNKFNKEVIVTKDGNEVKNGTVVGTGMKVCVKNPSKVDAEGDYAYEISVYGDTNGDGKSNQVELTRIIRNVVDGEKWELTGAKFNSADFTVDNKIDEKHVNKSVKYIVYGDMEIPEFDPVAAPTIEVIEGTFDKEDNCYTTDVKVKITETAKNGVKTQYRIEDSKGILIPYTEISREKAEDGKYERVIELKKEEIYKISAYTTGELGNRSEIPYLIVNGIYNNLREYRVEYYYKNLQNEATDTYVIDNEKTEKKYAEIGSQITTYTDKNKAGYELATEKGTNGVEGLPLTINKNKEENVIKVYYKIHHYGIRYNPNEGEWPNGENPNPETYTIETPTIVVEDPGRRGYEVEGWIDEDKPEDDPENEPEHPKTISEGTTGEINIKIIWKLINYNIEYKNIEGSTIESGEKVDTYTIKDTPLTLYIPKKEGFTFEGWTLTKLNNEVITDATKVTGIEEGEIGNREYTAHWNEIQPNSHRVTAEIVGGHGTIAPQSQQVEDGANVNNIEITPDENYVVSKAKIYSGPKDESRTYNPEEDLDGETIRTGRKGSDGKIKVAAITNITEDKHIVVKLKEKDTNVVAKIIEVPGGENGPVAQLESCYEDGEGILDHEYTSLEDAINDARRGNNKRDENGLTGTIKILILNNVSGELNQIETTDQENTRNEIIIDLNGYTISAASTEEPVINIAPGASLQVIDESQEENGAIINETGIGINISNAAELTLGEDDGLTNVSQKAPVIQGGTYGIYKEVEGTSEGTFNFYDGKIIGNTTGTGTSARGGSVRVDSTPQVYSLSESGEQPNPIIDVLEIDAGIEAVINTTTYSQVQKAFKDINDGIYGNGPVEIDLVKNASLDDSDFTDGSVPNQAIVNEGKSVILDLNGNTLTGTVSNGLIKNSGTLEIIDSTADVEEKITGTLKKYNNDDEYYFEEKNHIITSNYEGSDTAIIPAGYIEVNVPRRNDNDKYKLEVTVYGTGSIDVTETAQKPESYSKTNNSRNNRYTWELDGGKTYYIHLESTQNDDGYKFLISDVKLREQIPGEENTYGKAINFIDSLIKTKGVIDYNKDLIFDSDSNYLSCINNTQTGTLKINNVVIGSDQSKDYVSHKLINSGNLEIKDTTIIGKVRNYADDTKTVDLSDFILYGRYDGGDNSENATNINKLENGIMCGQVNIYGNISNAKNMQFTESAYFGGNTINITESKAGRLLINGVSNNLNTTQQVTITKSNIQALGNGGKTTIENCNIPAIGNYGTLTINGTTTSNDVSNMSGEVTINNINLNGQISNDNGTITIKGGTYNNAESEEALVNNINNSTTTINSGKFYSEGIGINVENSTINLGVKNTDSITEVSTTNPEIKAETYGIKITGDNSQFNFYDGIIIGEKDKAISGPVTSVEQVDGQNLELIRNNTIVEGKEYEEVTLGVSTDFCAQIKNTYDINPGDAEEDGGYYKFHTLQAAIAACKNGISAEIEIIKNIETLGINIPAEKKITIDLKGKTILTWVNNANNYGELTVKDSSTAQTGKIKGNTCAIYNNSNAKLHLNGGKLDSLTTKEVSYYTANDSIISSDEIKITVYNYGEATIEEFEDEETGIENHNTLNINNSIIGNIVNLDTSTINIEGTDTEITKIYNKDTAVVNVQDGKITTIYNNSEAQNTGLNITNGEITNIHRTKDVEFTVNETEGNEIKITNLLSVNNLTEKIILNNVFYVGSTTCGNLKATNTKFAGSSSAVKAELTDCETNGFEIGSGSFIKGTAENIANTKSIINGQIEATGSEDILIQNSKVNTYGIAYSGTAKLTIDKVNINTTGLFNSAVENKGNGTIYITSDENNVINSTSTNGVMNSGAGTIILGENEEGEDAKLYPSITSSKGHNAVYNGNSGTMKYYDGKLETNISDTVSTSPKALNNLGTIYYADGTVPISRTWNEEGTEWNYGAERLELLYYEEIHLGKENIVKISTQDAEKLNLSGIDYATVDGYYEFASLQDAINACKDNNEVTILLKRDITLNSETTISANKKIILDINEFDLSLSTEKAINNKGTLQIKDNSGSKAISITESKAVNNEGTLTLTNLNAKLTKEGTAKDAHVIGITNSGTLNITGEYSSTNTNANKFESQGKYQTFITNSSAGKVNINNMHITSANNYIYRNSNYSINSVVNSGECIINNSKLVGENIINENPGTIEISNSEFVGAILNNSTKKIEENVQNSKPAIKINNCILNVVNSLFTQDEVVADGTKYIMNTAGEILIDGENTLCKIETVSSLAESIGNRTIIYNKGTDAVLTIKNGNFNAYIFNYGKYTHENATVNGGIVNKGNGEVRIISGEYNDEYKNNEDYMYNADSATIIIGTKDGDIKETPLINYTNGAYYWKFGANAKFKFYDGEIKCKYYADDTSNKNLDGKITEIEDGCTINKEDLANGIRSYTLEKNDVAQIGNTQYETLKLAVEACTTSNKTTIEMLKDITITEAIAINANQNIVLDLKGHTISVNTENGLFTVNGTLEITDSTNTPGTINGKEDEHVTNTGTVISASGNVTINKGNINGAIKIQNPTSQKEVTINGGSVNLISNGRYVGSFYEYYQSKFIKLYLKENANVKNIDLGGWIAAEINGNNVCVENLENHASHAINKVEIIKDQKVDKILNYANVYVKGGIVGEIKKYKDSNTYILDNSLVGKVYDASTNYGATTIENSIILSNIEVYSASTTTIKENVKINPPDSELTNNERTTLTGYNQVGTGIIGGTVILGEKDYNVKKDTIKIFGDVYGINNSSIKYYDGVVKGGTKALGPYASVSETEIYYQTELTDEDKTMYLIPTGDINNSAGIDNNQTYETLNIALNAVEQTTSKTATIDLINKNTVVANVNEKIIIKSGMNITLRLNGYSITGALSSNPVLEVEAGATLTIIDTLGGKVENTAGLAIDNKGTLNIGESANTVNADAFSIKGATNAISNSGTLNFYNGILQAKKPQSVISGTDIAAHKDGYNVKDGTELIEEEEYNTKYLEEIQ